MLYRTIIWIGVIVAAWLVARFLSWMLGFIHRKFTSKTATKLDDYVIEALRREPFSHIAILLALVWVVNDAASNFPTGDERMISFLRHLLIIYGIFLGAVVVDGMFRAVLNWMREEMSQKSDLKVLSEFFPLLRKIGRTTIYAIAVVIVLSHLGVDVSALIVSMGVAGAAIALAVKDTIENAISGILIMLDRPFRIGDRIKLSSGEVGDIFDIGLRSTKILTFDNTLIILPNTKLLTEKITNLSYPNPVMRVKVEVDVAYGTDIDFAKNIMERIAKEHPDVLDEPQPKAYFVEFGESGLKLILMGRVGKYTNVWDTQNQLREMIYKEFAENQIEIPFPQMDVHIKRENDQ
ncbi:mechanosensitive ion channel family protein [bacterium]|nr:mechanosensitive ion channel family protein [bacterium]